jgi:hypothetical protein
MKNNECMFFTAHSPAFERVIRDAEDAENNTFSIAAESAAMEKHSAADAAKTTKDINPLAAR